MKRLLFLILMLASAFAIAQAPLGFSYQTVIRNSNGQPIANQSVKVHILLTDNMATTTYYEEQHTSLTTNAQGVAILTIGEGTLKQGTLDAVPWQNGEVYIKVEVDPTGTSGYQAMGQPVKLYSVPYALFAENAKEVVSQPTALDEDPIFVVKNKVGQIVFAVYQTGVRVYVEDTPIIKGSRGGFAVGGLSQTKAGSATEYFRITADSARIYTNKTTTKGARGGFAVGGLSQTKMVAEDYLQITPDSTRIYIDNSTTKGSRGGFAVGGMSQTKAAKTSFFNIETSNTSIIYPSQPRILWYPLKNAFLVGQVIVEKPDSVGLNSFATGYESKSKGKYSQAMGYMAKSGGDYSTAIGKKAFSLGINSFAFGDSAIASGTNSYALGNRARAAGNQSFAIGSWTRESPVSSILQTESTGTNSIAIGIGTKAKGDNAISIGSVGTYTIPPYPMPVYSTNNANGNSSMTLGYGNTAENSYSILVGRGNKSLADNGMAFGYGNSAKGTYSYAFGHGNHTIGSYSTAIGYFTIAKDNQSTVVGAYNDTTLTDVQFAVGYGTRVVNTVNRRNAFTVFKNGTLRMVNTMLYSDYLELNQNGTGNRTTGIDFHGDDTYTDFALRILRNNTGANASSQIHHRGTGNFELYAQEAAAMRFYTSGVERLTILSNGNVGVGNSNPSSYDLDVTGTGRFTTSTYFATSSGRVGIGLTNPSYKLDVYENSTTEIWAARIFKDDNNSANGGLMIQAGADNGSGTNFMVGCYNGAGTYKGGLAIVSNGNVSLATPSDIKLKKNVVNTSISGLSILNRLRVVDFEYKDSPGIKQTGYIAQEVKEVFPEMVSYNQQEDILQISQQHLIPIINKAIQEQQSIIETQRNEIKELKAENIELIKRLEKIEKLIQGMSK